MQVTNRIKKEAKSFTIVQTIANVFLKAIAFSFQAPVISKNNTSFLHLFNILQKTITSMLRNSDAEILQLMKEDRCFNCKGKRHTMLNCPKKTKFSVITDALDIYNIENID